MDKKYILPIIPMAVIIVLLVVVLVIVAILPDIRPRLFQTKAANAAMDKNSYNIGGMAKIKISNTSNQKMCFSSCYPYYLEIKNEKGFESYSYLECEAPNLAEKCVNPGETKAFEFQLAYARKGIHRLAISSCSSCEEGKEFKAEKWLYSNEFHINN